jgi:xanthine dehydrogenase accessory factor
MKHWQETAQLFDRIVCLSQAGRHATLATVVAVEGSSYRRPGAKLLIEEDGRTMGSVSGGCLEADVREAALAVLRGGVPRLLHYETGDDESPWSLGLGCGGTVDVFVHLATDGIETEMAARLCRQLGGEVRFALSTVVAGPSALGRTLFHTGDGAGFGSTGDGTLDADIAQRAAELLARTESALLNLGPWRVFTETLTPPPHLIVCGAGHDAVPLVAYSSDAGFRVTVLDHRPGLLTAERFAAATRLVESRPEEAPADLPGGASTYAVVMMHSLHHDREWVRRLLAAGLAYVGVLGPHARTEGILREIGATDDERVFGPVGLDLGAEGPEQIALSIVAELLAVRFGRVPRHLREKNAVVHAV